MVANLEHQNTRNCMNNQKWNLRICTSPQIVFFVIIIWVMQIFHRFIELKWLPDFNSFEKSLLVTSIYQIIINAVFPLYMYGKNMSMFRHLMHDILEEFIGIEIMPTNLPNLLSMSHLNVQKIKILLQKLQSKCETILNTSSSACHIKTSNNVDPVIKMSTETILNQVQEGKFNGDVNEKVDEEESNHNYPDYLTYLDQKALLSATRLKEAGFQLSKDTPEDGNCLIHALKDQMR